jgi:MraZ protein
VEKKGKITREGICLFRGINKLNLDAKGRMAVPTRFRERLQSCCASQLVITADPQRCLLIYPFPDWQEVERMLMKLPSFNKPARLLQRMMVGNATEVEMDSQGRVLVPPPLRDYAGLDRQAVLIGQGNKFELWDEAGWNDQIDEYQGIDLEQLELPPGFENLSI